MKGNILERIALGAVLISLCAHRSEAGGRAFTVRSYSGVSSVGSSGDRETGRSASFWFASTALDEKAAGYLPLAVRLAPDGSAIVWTVESTPQAAAPSVVRRDPVNGITWILVPLPADSKSILYSLETGSDSVIRWTIPFSVSDLQLDSVNGTPWLTGVATVAHLSGKTLTIIPIPHLTGVASRIDPSRRLWLAGDDGALRFLTVDNPAVDTYPDAGISASLLDVDSASGSIWTVPSSQDRIIRFEPLSRVKSTFPLVETSTSWGGLGLGPGGYVNLCSASGPHLLSQDPHVLTGGVDSSLAAPDAMPLVVYPTLLVPINLTATRQNQVTAVIDRTVYAEEQEGRTLYTGGGAGLGSILWSDGGDTVTGPDPIQWWQTVAPDKAFTTRSVLPVVAEVRPTDPTGNFLTEVTLTNVDAAASVDLLFQTATDRWTVTLDLPAGATRLFANAVQSLRDLGADTIPEGAVGTLEAHFVNGRGLLSARVYTKFGDDSKFPAGSTTGLGLTAVDPAARIFQSKTAINGLKSTPEFRTNVAAANLCVSTNPCSTLTLSLRFFDDSTGKPVGEATLEVPPGQLRQLNAPLASFEGAVGESFSVQIQPVGVPWAGYDAYATVISNVNQDAAFIRATSDVTSHTLTLPVVTDAGGISNRFTSECAITNLTDARSVADLTFTSVPSGTSVTSSITLEPGQGLRLPNAVEFFRKIDPARVGADDFGPLRIAFRDSGSGVASARTTASNGTGLAFDALDPYLARALQRKRIIGLKENDAYRTNLAVVHLGATTSDANAPITVTVRITDAQGKAVGTPLIQVLAPGHLVQWTKILSSSFGVTGEGYSAVIERTAGQDAFDAYVTVIDNVSTDPSFFRAE